MKRSLLQGLLIACRSKWRQLDERQNFTSSHYVGIFSPGYRKLFNVIILFKTANLQDGRRCCTNRSESSEMFATVVLSYLHGRNNWPSTHSCYYMMSLTKIKLLYILRLSLDSRNQSNHLIHSYVHCITSGSGMARTRCQQWLLDQEEGKVEATSSLPVLRTAAC